MLLAYCWTPAAQVEKEVQKAISMMEAVGVEINKKKEVSRKVGGPGNVGPGHDGAQKQAMPHWVLLSRGSCA